MELSILIRYSINSKNGKRVNLAELFTIGIIKVKNITYRSLAVDFVTTESTSLSNQINLKTILSDFLQSTINTIIGDTVKKK